MIVILATKVESEKFVELIELEAKKRLADGPLDLTSYDVYEGFMDAVKVRFRAWQMDQPGYKGSVAEHEYRMQRLRRRVYDEMVLHC